MKVWSVIGLIIASAIVLSLLVVAPLVLAFSGSLDRQTLFGLAGLVFSWPIATLILGLLFMTRFHSSIDAFLRNIAHMRLPGGFELQSQVQLPTATEPTGEEVPPVLSEDEEKQLVELRSKIGELEKLSQAEKDLLSRQYEMALGAVSFWKFSYLNLFLVPQTKHVLLWCSQNPPQTRTTYSALWAPVIHDEKQRMTILEVLLQNGLLEEAEGMIRISQEGYGFLQFTGAIPYPPQPAQQQGA